MYDYKAMSVFATVVELGSMQAAADKLFMTPSAVTQTIQKLEGQLKIKLLNRTTRKLSLTEAGEAFYQHVSQLQKTAEEAVKSVEMLRSSPIGQLNITCPTGLTDSLFIKVFQSILANHPEFHLNLSFDDKPLDLVESRIDIAIRAGEKALNDTMIARHLCDLRCVIVAHKDYLVDKTMPDTLEALAELDWINFSNDRSPLSLMKDEQEFKIQPNYRITANTLYASRRLTLNGLGVSMQPLEDVKNQLASKELIALLPDYKLPVVPLYLVTLQRIQSEKVRIVYELILNYFKQIKFDELNP